MTIRWTIYAGDDVPVRVVGILGLVTFLVAGASSEYVYPFRVHYGSQRS